MELQEVERSENNVDKDSYFVKDESVMPGALDVLTALDASKRVVLLAKGNLIPNAVAIANIVTENMLKGNSKIEDIKLDSVISEEDGQMISNIDIILTAAMVMTNHLTKYSRRDCINEFLFEIFHLSKFYIQTFTP